jgi:hypothetical protein
MFTLRTRFSALTQISIAKFEEIPKIPKVLKPYQQKKNNKFRTDYRSIANTNSL